MSIWQLQLGLVWQRMLVHKRIQRFLQPLKKELDSCTACMACGLATPVALALQAVAYLR